VRAPRILGSLGVPAALNCPLCGLPVALEIRRFFTRIDSSTARKIKETHPHWSASDGACPECVHQASEAVRQARSQTSLHEELLLPYPVYAAQEARLIPTPQRMPASPQYTGQGVTIAFIDAGFYPHPDLTRPHNRILCYVDATDDEPVELDDFGPPQPADWHGLMTSCVAAGNGYKSGYLYRGIACQANLVLVKAGNPRKRGILEIDIQRALSWVIANQRRFNIRVINISLGGDYAPRGWQLCDLDQKVEQASANGMVVVTAAGNSGIQRLLPPATAPSAITVGGLDDRNSQNSSLWRMYHSNYGMAYQVHPKPEVIATAVWLAAPMLPGSEIHKEGVRLWQKEQVLQQWDRLVGSEAAWVRAQNDDPAPMSATRRNIRQRMVDQKYIHPHYQHVDGTSMAAPVVSSIVAQLLEANPALSPEQVKHILMSTAIPLAGVPEEQYGAGAINGILAVAAARRLLSGGVMHGLPLSPNVQPGQITFYYYDPSRKSVSASLVGSFNRWNPRGYALHSPSPGLWQISIPGLPGGRYRYKFLIDDHWMEDPENPHRLEDGYGGFNSILDV
jgi:serine protease AprX